MKIYVVSQGFYSFVHSVHSTPERAEAVKTHLEGGETPPPYSDDRASIDVYELDAFDVPGKEV